MSKTQNQKGIDEYFYLPEHFWEMVPTITRNHNRNLLQTKYKIIVCVT